MVNSRLDLIIDDCIRFNDYFSEKCTGIFQDNHPDNIRWGIQRPPAGTPCTSSCFYESGPWGSSWCWTDEIEFQWGAECVECESQSELGTEFLY